MIGKWIDRAIGLVSPAWATRRMLARATMSQIDAFSGGDGGYDAGKWNRLTKSWSRSKMNENAVPRAQVENMRHLAWDLWRNNCHARKVVRTLTSKVIGRGMVPQSQAVGPDGKSHVEFRAKAKQIWLKATKELDHRGRPGSGGQDLSSLAKTAFRGVILGGETLFRIVHVAPGKAKDRGLTLPLQVQLISADRLDAQGQLAANNRNIIVHGVEFDADGQRIAYYILDRHPSEVGGVSEPKRVPAKEVRHVFISDDIDQVRGVSWFSAPLMQMRDTGDYQYNELKASAVAACVAMGVRKPTGASKFGLQSPSGGEVTDADGNPLTSMQPGMIVNLGTDGALEGFNPGRPTTNAEAWIQHMVRTTATGVPGVKSSTLTGDYRNSSFSSERSADNDAWPELEEVQDWFAASFYQPIYEEVITAAVLAGLFDGVVTPDEFVADKKNFLEATWQGPVALSINPADDAKAGSLRVAGGQSSPQLECAKRGLDWQQVMKDVDEFIEFCGSINIPEEVYMAMLGVKVQEPEQGGESGQKQAA